MLRLQFGESKPDESQSEQSITETRKATSCSSENWNQMYVVNRLWLDVLFRTQTIFEKVLYYSHPPALLQKMEVFSLPHGLPVYAVFIHTLSVALRSAPRATKAMQVGVCPFCAALCRGVWARWTKKRRFFFKTLLFINFRQCKTFLLSLQQCLSKQHFWFNISLHLWNQQSVRTNLMYKYVAKQQEGH